MIGVVYLDADSGRCELKLSASAMMRMQSKTGQTFTQTVQGLQEQASDGDFDLVLFFGMFSEIMNRGKGATPEECSDLIDEVGLETAIEAFSDAVQKAFPEADAAPGKPKPRPKTGRPRKTGSKS